MSDEQLLLFAGVTWGVIGTAYAAVSVWLGVRLFNRRERWAKWTIVALVLMPVLYVLSSGPMTILAFRTRITRTSTTLPNGSSAVQASAETNLGTWFPFVYAPVLWAVEQGWGESLFSYWDLFPNRETYEEP
jgi:hypothetical protein